MGKTLLKKSAVIILLGLVLVPLYQNATKFLAPTDYRLVDRADRPAPGTSSVPIAISERPDFQESRGYSHHGVTLAHGDWIHQVYSVSAGRQDFKKFSVHRSSCNQGKTWSSEAIISPGIGAFGISSTGRLVGVFSAQASESSTRWISLFSEDNGKTWSKPVPLGGEWAVGSRPTGRISLLKDGRLAFSATAMLVGDKKINFAMWYSADDGKTWIEGTALATLPASKFDAFSDASFVDAGGGRLLAVARGTETLRFFKSNDAGKSWVDFGEHPFFADVKTTPGNSCLIQPFLDIVSQSEKQYFLLTYANRCEGHLAMQVGSLRDFVGTPYGRVLWGEPMIVEKKYPGLSGSPSTVVLASSAPDDLKLLMTDFKEVLHPSRDENGARLKTILQSRVVQLWKAGFEAVDEKSSQRDLLSPVLDFSDFSKILVGHIDNIEKPTKLRSWVFQAGDGMARLAQTPQGLQLKVKKATTQFAFQQKLPEHFDELRGRYLRVRVVTQSAEALKMEWGVFPVDRGGWLAAVIGPKRFISSPNENGCGGDRQCRCHKNVCEWIIPWTIQRVANFTADSQPEYYFHLSYPEFKNAERLITEVKMDEVLCRHQGQDEPSCQVPEESKPLLTEISLPAQTPDGRIPALLVDQRKSQ